MLTILRQVAGIVCGNCCLAVLVLCLVGCCHNSDTLVGTAATMSAYTAATIACSPSCGNVGSAAMIVPGEGTVALNAKIALMPQCSNYELS